MTYQHSAGRRLSDGHALGSTCSGCRTFRQHPLSRVNAVERIFGAQSRSGNGETDHSAYHRKATFNPMPTKHEPNPISCPSVAEQPRHAKRAASLAQAATAIEQHKRRMAEAETEGLMRTLARHARAVQRRAAQAPDKA